MFKLEKKVINEKKLEEKTTQLRNEQKHKDQFNKECGDYGLCIVEDWGSGSKNKKRNNNADLNCEIIDINKLSNKLPYLSSNLKNDDIITVSLKTKGGDFTIANIGTTHNRTELFKYMNLTNVEIENFKKTNKKIKYIKKNFDKNEKWKDNETHKNIIKKLYTDLLYKIFQIDEHKKELYKWLCERESNLKYVGNKLFIPEKYTFPEECKVEIKGIDTVIVGRYALRAKAEGSKVKGSWKFNIELNQ